MPVDRGSHLAAVRALSPRAGTDLTRTTVSSALVSGATSACDTLAVPLGSAVPAGLWDGYPEELVRALSSEGKPFASPFFADQAYLLHRAGDAERRTRD
ncbi:hypothetical protein [Streptomyces sp. URMC 129]|uniref:hypothetical protein n=1 Tax=Streptomyces sp. URMC 129 TaxID=3423407 RepID=UPI003F1C00C3